LFTVDVPTVFPFQILPLKVTRREVLKKGKKTETIQQLKQRGREIRNTGKS